MRANAAIVVLKNLAVWLQCLGLGAGYGVVAGAAVGTLLAPLYGTIAGALIGLAAGLVGGGVAGVIGSVGGGKWGWCLAGVLGGMAPAVVLQSVLHEGIAWFVFVIGPSILVAGWLGRSVDRGLHSGESGVPGVTGLITLINDAHAPRRSARALGVPTEVAPTSAPQGRGDEAASVATL